MTELEHIVKELDSSLCGQCKPKLDRLWEYVRKAQPVVDITAPGTSAQPVPTRTQPVREVRMHAQPIIVGVTPRIHRRRPRRHSASAREVCVVLVHVWITLNRSDHPNIQKLGRSKRCCRWE